jgi:hypothetical protein
MAPWSGAAERFRRAAARPSRPPGRSRPPLAPRANRARMAAVRSGGGTRLSPCTLIPDSGPLFLNGFPVSRCIGVVLESRTNALKAWTNRKLKFVLDLSAMPVAKLLRR